MQRYYLKSQQQGTEQDIGQDGFHSLIGYIILYIINPDSGEP